MSKIDTAQRQSRPVFQVPQASEAPESGGSDPIQPGTGMPIPGGSSYERAEPGGKDTTPPKPPTDMPIPGR